MSFSALACFKATGSFAVDGEKWKIDHKVEPHKEYIFPMGTFILKMTIKPNKDKHDVLYVVQEKKGTTLLKVTEGIEEEVVIGQSRDIFAKGEEGQPNSIITIKLIDI